MRCNNNIYHAEGLSRRHVQKCHKIFKNVNIIELHYYIWNWNPHRKCSQISTNMPGIGLVIREIAFQMFIILRKH